MIRFRQALRLIYINAVLIRHGLDEIILTTPLLRPVRFLLYLLPWNRNSYESSGVLKQSFSGLQQATRSASRVIAPGVFSRLTERLARVKTC